MFLGLLDPELNPEPGPNPLVRYRYGSGDPDPDPHQNVTDPQHLLSMVPVPSSFYGVLVKMYIIEI